MLRKKLNDSEIETAWRIATLVTKYHSEKLTDQEMNELLDWVGKNESKMALFKDIMNPENIEKAKEWLNQRKPK